MSFDRFLAFTLNHYRDKPVICLIYVYRHFHFLWSSINAAICISDTSCFIIKFGLITIRKYTQRTQSANKKIIAQIPVAEKSNFSQCQVLYNLLISTMDAYFLHWFLNYIKATESTRRTNYEVLDLMYMTWVYLFKSFMSHQLFLREQCRLLLSWREWYLKFIKKH